MHILVLNLVGSGSSPDPQTLDPAGSNISGPGLDPDPAESESSGSGASLLLTQIFLKYWLIMESN